MAFKGSRPVLCFLLLATLPWVPRTGAEPTDCAKVINVTVNGTDSRACLQGNGSCRTLHYAFTNCTITSSTQFLIGPGTFNLTQDLGTIYDTPFSWLEGLVVKGSGAEDTIIDCSDESGLAFVNMTNLMISDLTLFNCSQNRSSTSIGNVSEPHTIPFLVGLYVWRCTGVVIEDVHINETIGVGLVLYETVGRVSITSSVFHHNGIPENMTDTLYGGGGVNVEFPYCPPGHYNDDECDKELSGVEYVFNDCNFTNNTAHIGLKYSEQFITQEWSSHQSFGRGGGMAIYFSGNSSDNNVSLSNCHFVGNRAVFGGGLLGEFNDGAQHNSMKVLSCKFLNNSCFNSAQVNGVGGGARLGFLLYEANSVANNEIHIEQTLFEQNKAYLGGGVSFVTGHEQGVLAPTNRFAMMSPIFEHNIARLGSAVNLMPWKSLSTGLVAKVEIQDGCFANNSVLYDDDAWYLMGFGTVYSYKVPFDIKGDFVYHYNVGSGIVVVGTGVNVRSGSAIDFAYNVATNGGGIAVYANGWITLWNGTSVDFIANKAQNRGGAIYSESTGGSQILESRDCVIRYFEWWRSYEEWDSRLNFDRNVALEAGDDIFVSSLFPCIRSGSNGSADTSIDARKKVFRATPTFQYSSNLTDNSIVTGAANITFKVNVSRDMHITVYPGQVFQFSTKIRPLDELGALSQVPFFATTNVSTNVSDISTPSAEVAPNSVYTTGYLQFQASHNVEYGNVSTTVQLQTVSEPALLFSFNVTLAECPPGSYLSFPSDTRPGQCACARNSSSPGYLTGIICYEHRANLSIFRQASMWYGKVPSKNHSVNISVTTPCPLYCDRNVSLSDLVPLNQTNPISGVCLPNSHGTLCGTCDYGVLITSYIFECCTLEDIQAVSAAGAWAAWIGLQFILTFVIVAVILLFDFDVIGGTLCSFVFFSQIVLDLNLPGCTSGESHVVIQNIERAYAVWSLRFRWIMSFRLCMSSFDNTLSAISLDYLFAFCPFGLIFIGAIIARCHGKFRGNCCSCYQSICSFIDQIFYRFRKQIKQRTFFVHGITTCLILTYGDLVSISMTLLSPTKLNVPDGIDPNDIEGGPWRSLYKGNFVYFGRQHVGYGVLASITMLVFGLGVPLYFLVLRQCYQHFKRPCLQHCKYVYRKCRKCCTRDGTEANPLIQDEPAAGGQEAQHFGQNEELNQEEAKDQLLEHFKDRYRFFVGMWLYIAWLSSLMMPLIRAAPPVSLSRSL